MARRRLACSGRAGGWPAALRRRLAGDRGEASIQMAIIFPFVILVTVAVVQAAMWVHARSIALTAAREGVAAARVYQAPDGAGAARALETLGRIAGDSLTATSVSTSGSSATDVRVTVTGSAPSLIPGVGGLSVSQSAGAPRERWTTP
ncbi:pilus assembly protein [Streptomyces flavotricini]|uniref:Pilus assembly protein n=1 Tax=Streptomyces flavotricini TaxID=66888 RepID=A0ABS8EKE1_9ACTN|nr:TadE family protein [Streptomyces flavotricini]MCC0100679.1 pilus assembly protein [Streptomyces flavotricini]